MLIPHKNRAAISQHEANRLQHHERKEELFAFSSLSLAQSSKSNNNKQFFFLFSALSINKYTLCFQLEHIFSIMYIRVLKSLHMAEDLH